MWRVLILGMGLQKCRLKKTRIDSQALQIRFDFQWFYVEDIPGINVSYHTGNSGP